MAGASGLYDETVCEAVGGSTPAIELVLRALEPQVRVMVAARLLPSPGQMDTVDDLVQQVLEAVSDGIARLERKTPAGLKAYVSTIAGRKVANYLRSLPRHGLGGPMRSLDSTVYVASHAGPLWQFLSASLTPPSLAAHRDEQINRLMRELPRLKDSHRQAIILAFFDQIPTGEIAKQMNISREAAAGLIKRALCKLRRRMAEPPASAPDQ